MNKDYPFSGEVTLSVEQYSEMVLELDKAKRDRDMYKMSYEYHVKKSEELEAKIKELEAF